MQKHFLLGVMIIASQNIFSANSSDRESSSPDRDVTNQISASLALLRNPLDQSDRAREIETPFNDSVMSQIQEDLSQAAQENEELTPRTTPHSLGFPPITNPQPIHAPAPVIRRQRLTPSTLTHLRQERYDAAKDLAENLLRRSFDNFRDLTLSELTSLKTNLDTLSIATHNMNLDGNEENQTRRYLAFIIASRQAALSPSPNAISPN